MADGKVNLVFSTIARLGGLPEPKQFEDEHREENHGDDDSDPESAWAHIVSRAAHDKESIANG